MPKPKPYVVVAHMPACSAVLFVRSGEVTILTEHTASHCEAFALGFARGSGIDQTLMGGAVKLPAGNPALSYSKMADQTLKIAQTYSQATDAEISQRLDHAGDPLPEPMPDDETPEEWTRRKQADERVQSQRDALEDPSAR